LLDTLKAFKLFIEWELVNGIFIPIFVTVAVGDIAEFTE
jgi:hypothetical protein